MPELSVCLGGRPHLEILSSQHSKQLAVGPWTSHCPGMLNLNFYLHNKGVGLNQWFFAEPSFCLTISG